MSNLDKTRYSDAELKEFDELIDQKLNQAKIQLKFYQDQIQELNESDDAKQKSIDDGAATADAEHLHNMASRQQKLIQHLGNAKLRIKNKVYGICRETGTLISKERLRAVPHATLSINAKHGQNK